MNYSKDGHSPSLKALDEQAHLGYFDIIPYELTEIIVSYFDYDTFEHFNIDNLNYHAIYYYHFNQYKMILNKVAYEQYLGLDDLKKKLKLRYTLDELKELYILDL